MKEGGKRERKEREESGGKSGGRGGGTLGVKSTLLK